MYSLYAYSNSNSYRIQFIKDNKSAGYHIEFADIVFGKMCEEGYIQNENLFNSFKHTNKFVRNTIKKINRK